MGFFFSKARLERARNGNGAAKPHASGGTGPRGKVTAAALNRLACKACPLVNEGPEVPAKIPKRCEILFLGEAPGREEVDQLTPFVGVSGKLIRRCIPEDMEKYCGFGNTVRHRPSKDNRTPTWQEMECCRSFITAEIEKAKPKLIVGMGATALQWMLNSKDLRGLRGRYFAVKVGEHKCWFMPSYHPSFILRVAHDKKEPLKGTYGHCFQLDMKRAFSLLKKLPAAEVHTLEQVKADIKCFDGSKDTDLPDVLELLGEAMKAPRVSIDYETEGLRPYAAGAAVLSCAISYEHKTFSFAIDHPKSGWKGTPRLTVLNKLRKLLTHDVLKVAHNTPFEVEWSIFLFGKEVVNHACWEDPMMQAQFIDERRGTQVRDQDDRKAAYQSLDFLVKKYFGISIKEPFKLDKKHMSKSPLPEMLLYNGVDAKYTLLLHQRQYDIILDDDVLDAYFEAVPRQPTVALMQYFGMKADGEKVFAHQFRLADEIDEIIGKISELKVIKQYVKDHESFNPNSNQEVLAVFQDYLHRPEVVVVPKHHEVHDFDKSNIPKKKFDEGTDRGPRLSVDKAVLQQIDHPLAGLILELRERTKLKSTYVDIMAKTPALPDGSPSITSEKANGTVVNETFVGGTGSVIYPDGRLHTTYNCTFPETGRLSSDSPNLQNFPKRHHAEIRDQVSADPGCVLVAVDYGQLEWATTAICTRDKVIVKANWDEYDVHMEWAEKIARAYPKIVGGPEVIRDKEAMKKFRSLVKNKMVFPVIFGARNESVRAYLSNATGVDFPEKICNDILDEFSDTFSGLRNWQAATLKSYHQRGYVESPTGRRHYYPLNPNQIINQPIQSVAADIVCDGMNRLSYMACTTGQWHLHPRLNVHDDLTFNVPDDEKLLEEAVATIYKTMLTPAYDFINVPLSVEIAVGPNWFELESLGKFWSHRDLDN